MRNSDGAEIGLTVETRRIAASNGSVRGVKVVFVCVDSGVEKIFPSGTPLHFLRHVDHWKNGRLLRKIRRRAAIYELEGDERGDIKAKLRFKGIEGVEADLVISVDELDGRQTAVVAPAPTAEARILQLQESFGIAQ